MEIKYNSFNISFQNEIISFLFNDANFASKFYKYIIQDKDLKSKGVVVLDGKFQSLLMKFFIELYSDSEFELPSPGVVEQKIKSSYLDSSEKEEILSLLNRVRSMDLKCTKAHLLQLSGLLKMVKLSSFIETYDTMLEGKKFKKLEISMGEFVDEMQKLTFEDESLFGMNNFMELIEESAVASSQNIPTGIEEIDKILNSNAYGKNGGLAKEELTVVLSGTNDGKSLATISIACNAIRNGQNVLHVNLEGKRLQAPIRYISNLSNIQYKKLTGLNKKIDGDNEFDSSGYFSSSEMKQIKDAEEKCGQNLHILHSVKFGENTIENLCAQVREFSKTKKLDLLVVDSGELLDSLKRTDSRYQELTVVFNKLDMLAKELKIAVVSPVQSNREGIKHLESDPEECGEPNQYSRFHIGGSLGIGQVAGCIIGLNRTKDERKAARLRWSIVKQREGRTNYQVGIDADFERCNLTTGNRYFLPDEDNAKESSISGLSSLTNGIGEFLGEITKVESGNAKVNLVTGLIDEMGRPHFDHCLDVLNEIDELSISAASEGNKKIDIGNVKIDQRMKDFIENKIVLNTKIEDTLNKSDASSDDWASLQKAMGLATRYIGLINGE
jgi:replicative DNA helicase